MQSVQNPKIGRPSKFSPELCEKLCELLAKGLTVEQACAHLGISDRTFRRWSRRRDFEYLRHKARAARKLWLQDAVERSEGNPVTLEALRLAIGENFPEQFGQQTASVAVSMTPTLSITVEQNRAIEERTAKLSPEVQALLEPKAFEQKQPIQQVERDDSLKFQYVRAPVMHG